MVTLVTEIRITSELTGESLRALQEYLQDTFKEWVEDLNQNLAEPVITINALNLVTSTEQDSADYNWKDA